MRIIKKFGDAKYGWRGLTAVWREEWHFKYQVSFAISALTIALIFGASAIQLVLLACFCCLALASEIANTAIEDIGNRINPDFDEQIGAIKDMAQAFVIVCSLPSLIVFLWILLSAIL